MHVSRKGIAVEVAKVRPLVPNMPGSDSDAACMSHEELETPATGACLMELTVRGTVCQEETQMIRISNRVVRSPVLPMANPDGRGRRRPYSGRSGNIACQKRPGRCLAARLHTKPALQPGPLVIISRHWGSSAAPSYNRGGVSELSLDHHARTRCHLCPTPALRGTDWRGGFVTSGSANVSGTRNTPPLPGLKYSSMSS